MGWNSPKIEAKDEKKKKQEGILKISRGDGVGVDGKVAVSVWLNDAKTSNDGCVHVGWIFFGGVWVQVWT